MQNHAEHQDEPRPRSNRRAMLIGITIAALLAVVVALHLSGTVG